MHRQQRSITVVCLIPLLTVTLGGAPQEQPTTTIKTSTQEVVLDVVVRDSHGKIVKGLTQKDFQILEDGTPQQIKSFSFTQGRDALQTQQAGSATRTPAVANPLRAVNLVCIVYQNLDPYTKKDAIAASKEFLNSHFSPDTWIAVYSLTGELVALHPFTTNRAELLKAADHAFSGTMMDFVSSATEVLNATPNVDYTANGPANTSQGSAVIATAGKVTGGGLNTTVNNDASASTSIAANRMRGDLAGQRRQFGGLEAQRQTDQIIDLIEKLATLPGRKSVLLVSPGLPSNGDADLFKSVLNKANKANITFYGLDVNGLTENSNVGAANNA
uniref:VWA domain-containing protein n=1 Tax=Nevskia soli TaxID=418856 RepID=UPI0015D85772